MGRGTVNVTGLSSVSAPAPVRPQLRHRPRRESMALVESEIGLQPISRWVIVGVVAVAIVIAGALSVFAIGMLGDCWGLCRAPDPLLVQFRPGTPVAHELSVLQSCRHFPTVISIEVNPNDGMGQIDTRDDVPFSPNLQPLRTCLKRSPLVQGSGWGG
jgi:hypothetical protein